jgi:hypothetical protein
MAGPRVRGLECGRYGWGRVVVLDLYYLHACCRLHALPHLRTRECLHDMYFEFFLHITEDPFGRKRL